MAGDLRILPAEEGQQDWGQVYVNEIRLTADPLVKVADSIVYHCATHRERLNENKEYVECVRHAKERIRDYANALAVKRIEEAAKRAERAESTLSQIRAIVWNKTSEKLPDDDSAVFAAIWWKGDSPANSGYEIHDCLYYEGGGEEPRQKIFADCDGDEFEPADVQFWIYKTELAKTVPAYPELLALVGKE